jgi:glycosyltransferase involved in cell wall biosynthesis
MRILSIAFALATVGDGAVGGAEQILAHIDRALVAAGHESLVVAASNSQIHGQLFGTAPAPQLVTGDYYWFRYAEHRRKIEDALNSGPIDLVHMHGFDFHEFIPEGDVPVLATLHLPARWYVNWIYYNQRPHFHLNCVSNSQRREVQEPALIARTIQNGVEIPELKLLPIAERDGAVILGRICPEKGTHLGIAAAQRAGVPLTIAGRAWGYPEHLEYFNKQIRPALQQRVTYLGPVGSREKTELLRRARCVLVPSIAPETSSLVAMEALSCGTPVIAMRSGALPEIVEDSKTGFLVSSVEEMAAAMSRVEEIDPQNCRMAAIHKFCANRMAREYIELYEQLIGEKNSAAMASRASLAEPQYH